MNASCPHAHISYATWRLAALRRLCADTETTAGPRLSFLYPRASEPIHSDRRSFHGSTARSRGKVKDLKRSAKHRGLQLELEKYVKPGVEAVNGSAPSNTPISSSHAKSAQKQSEKGWDPFAESSIAELQELVGDLHVMAKEAADKHREEEEEGVLFESGTMRFARRKPGQPESPLERKLPWMRDQKLNAREVEVDKKLENNIWAQLLASPVRMDRGTKVRLPRGLMSSWGVMQSPKNDKDYLLPIELSDLERLRQKLSQEGDGSLTQEKISQSETTQITSPNQHKHEPRVQITPSRILLQAMSDELTSDQVSRKGEKVGKVTASNKVKSNLVPFRWRFKQEEFQAYYKTRQTFNEALNRSPDEDEPSLDNVARLEKLQWQADIADRLGKILSERVLIALEAVGRDNTSGRAVHDRRVIALPIPKHGRAYIDARGRLLEDDDIPSQKPTEGNEIYTEPEETTMPDWIHGAVFIHIGSPADFHSTIERWHQEIKGQQHNNGRYPPALPSYDLIPPMITINDQIRLPIFNLETMLNEAQIPKLHQLIRDHEILDLNFWQDRKSNSTESTTNFESNTNVDPHIPESALSAGEQVLSSIITPNLDTEDLTSTDQVTSTIPNSTPNLDQNQSYLILIKPRAKHAAALTREIWQLWRFLDGRIGLRLGGDSDELSSKSDEY